MTSPPILWTIGHSTRAGEEFVALLNAHGIKRLVDIRTVPRSRYNPQFNGDALARTLRDAGLVYAHLPSLGGLRMAGKDSPNTGWRNDRFRGYADHMQTEEFERGLQQLIADGRGAPTAIMCAEAVPWRCHRSLVADALLSHGWAVRHILTRDKANEHRMTPFAVIEHGRLSYPQPADPAAAPTLF